MRVLRGLCAAALLAGSGSLAAASYFVSPSGSDGNDGSVGAPWRTLQKAADSARAGDVVTVRAGTYAGFVLGWDDPQNGTPSSPITFHAEPGVVINAPNAHTPDGINLEGASYVVIDGFTLTGLPRAGIRSVTNTGAVIRNNVADANGTWGIFTGFSDDITIEGNQASRSGAEHGIYVSNACVNPTVRRNVVFGNHKAGIHMNGDLVQGGNGLITGALVERNVIFENGTGGGSGINCDGVQSSVFRDNLLYGNHASGISLYRIDAADGAKDNLVVNNTFAMASDARWAVNIVDGSTGNAVRNNILLDANPRYGSINISADSLPGFTSDFNAVVDRFTPDDGGTVLTLAQWRTATGQDEHSFVATPAVLFRNADANDYHLAAGSPAIDAATSTGAPAYDVEGSPRPHGSAFDVGAYEAVPSAPLSLTTLSPCRVLDTRNAAGPLGGPALGASARRSFAVTGTCGIPPTALAISVNVSVVAPGAPGYLSLLPGNGISGATSSLNFSASQTRTNNAIVPLASDWTGTLAILNGSAAWAHVVVDVNGVFQ